MVSRKARWKLTLLVRTQSAEVPFPSFALEEVEEEPPLIGFVVYRLKPEQQAFAIAKIAVVPEHRGQGHGGRLMDWCMRVAKKQPDINFITLSSLPEAIRFYKKLGFKEVQVSLKQDPDEE